jgi:superfamily II DNA/RNA helicase
LPARDGDARRERVTQARGPLMEAEALTTEIWTMQSVPETERAMPHTLEPDALTPEEVAIATVTTDETASTTPPDDMTFRDFGVAEPFCVALDAAGITHAFPIQALTLPIALAGHDLIGQARTGTGKTLAFGVPLLQRLELGPARVPSAPRALVVVPTRELAIQVAEDLRITAKGSDINIVTLYGGRAYEPQIEALLSVDVVVSTPGRLLDLVRQGHLSLSHAHALVLDEADKMLDLGFLPDVEKILRLTPAQRQTMLFSATMPGEVVTLARRHMNRPMHVRAEQHDEPALVPRTQQHVFRAHQMDKIEVLSRVLQSEGRGLTIVFCRTKRAADQVAVALTTRGFAAAAVHGDLGQGQRERAMRAFRTGKVDVLVATDVAARGLDVDDVTHVINYECPEDDKAYLHRTGRTGRAGRDGVAVTFVDWADMHRWKMINEALVLDRPEPVETYSTSDHLYESLHIPRDAAGVLPSAQRARLGLEAEVLEDIGETGKTRSQSGRGAGARGGSADRGSRDHSSRDSSSSDRGGRDRGPRSDSRERTHPGSEPGRAGEGGEGRRSRARRRTRAGAPVRGDQGRSASNGSASNGGAPNGAGTADAGQAQAKAASPDKRGTRGSRSTRSAAQAGGQRTAGPSDESAGANRGRRSRTRSGRDASQATDAATESA